MSWKFHHAPDGLKDWASTKPSTEYIQYYVEDDPGVRVGYYGYAKQIHEFEYARGNMGFQFKVVSANAGVDRNATVQSERHLGPNCKVWVDKADVAELMAAGTANCFVSDVLSILLSGVLLGNTAHAEERLGPPILRVVFQAAELERLNSSHGSAK